MTEVLLKTKNIQYEGQDLVIDKVTELKNNNLKITFLDSIIFAAISEKEFNDLQETGVAVDLNGNPINSNEAQEHYKAALKKIEKSFDGKNKPEYRYYIVTNQNRILSGFEFREDAISAKDNLSLKAKNISRIISKRDMTVDVELEDNWGDKNYSIVDSTERAISFYKSEAHNDFDSFINTIGLPVELKSIEKERKLISSIEQRMKDGSDLTDEELKLLKKMLSVYSDGLIKKYQKSISYSYDDISRILSDEISNVSELISEIK